MRIAPRSPQHHGNGAWEHVASHEPGPSQRPRAGITRERCPGHSFLEQRKRCNLGPQGKHRAIGETSTTTRREHVRHTCRMPHTCSGRKAWSAIATFHPGNAPTPTPTANPATSESSEPQSPHTRPTNGRPQHPHEHHTTTSASSASRRPKLPRAFLAHPKRTASSRRAIHPAPHHPYPNVFPGVGEKLALYRLADPSAPHPRRGPMGWRDDKGRPPNPEKPFHPTAREFRCGQELTLEQFAK